MEIGFNTIKTIDSKKIKINENKQINKLDAYKAQGGDEFEISSTAKDYSVAMQGLKEIPDVREDVVAQYKEKLHSGEYTISPDAIAEKMLNGMLG